MQMIDMGRLKIILVVTAIIFAIASLYFSNRLAHDLSEEEKIRMELWADAIRAYNNADEHTDLTLVLNVLNANNTIPVIVIDSNDEIHTYRNIKLNATDSSAYLKELAHQYHTANKYVRIDTDSLNHQYIDVCYDDSLMLTRLSTFPYVQLLALLAFLIIAIFAILSFKKSEQNRVWVGLSKETAHQLGTPISSLYAWVELLADKYPSDELLPCMKEDIDRLQQVANRFSKIGSTPELVRVDLKILLKEIEVYMRSRISSKVKLELLLPNADVILPLNAALFGWVIENLCKNAIDAMDGAGEIKIELTDSNGKCLIDVSDTGKGIMKSRFKTIFTPGYTTKSRGWGLGLSLARRIIQDYHSGLIFVKQSEVNKGTVFRIELKK